MDKSNRGNASQFFVAGELCRRGFAAVVTLGNTPHTDILCSNLTGTKFVHIQVKTFVPGIRTVSVGRKAEINYGANFVWVLAGIPKPDSVDDFVYFIIPSEDVSKHVSVGFQMWLQAPGMKGQPHKQNDVRTIHLPPRKCPYTDWDISDYKNKWSIITDLLQEASGPTCAGDSLHKQ